MSTTYVNNNPFLNYGSSVWKLNYEYGVIKKNLWFMDNYFEKNNSSIISLLLCFMFEIQMLLFQREKNETNSLTVSSWDEGTQPLTFLWAVNFVVGTRITCLIHWKWFYFNTATITWMWLSKTFFLKKKKKKQKKVLLSCECNPIQDMSFWENSYFFFFFQFGFPYIQHVIEDVVTYGGNSSWLCMMVISSVVQLIIVYIVM